MTSAKLDVIWSPVHHDKFIIWGQDITLYEVARLKDSEKRTYTPISSTRGATVIASQSANGVRCVDISSITEHPEPLLALGHASGKVSLTSLRQTYDPLGLVGRQLVPLNTRLCNSVSWSPVETYLLAAALEKHRSDHCILLWDVSRDTLPVAENGESAATESKPLAEMGLSETAHSVSWSHCANRTLVASMNLKFIKIFDLRDLSNKAVSVATTRYCFEAISDPLNPWQVASRGEHVICVWDARAFDRPLLTLPQPKPVAKIQWCPTRRNLLLSLQRDSCTLRLHDIQQSNSNINIDNGTFASEAEEEMSPSVLERDVAPARAPPAPDAPSPPPLAAFACHPAHEARLLAVGSNGTISDYTVCERITVAWGAGGARGGGGLAWGGGGALRRLGGELARHVRDVSHVMRARAETDYGLKPDIWQNADLADDEALSGLWHFLALSKSLVEDGCIRNSQWRHPGVVSVLCGAGEGYRSEPVPSLLAELPARRLTVYRSAERTRALSLCGWGWGWENAAAGVERAEAEGTPCRAAALAAFQLRLKLALDVLARAHQPQLRVVGLALAGLGSGGLWRGAAGAAAAALPDPYLRALLAFLRAATEAQPELQPVLDETEMRLEDRVAFACIFLSDAKLHEYIKTTTEALIEQGDLSGILLTGASPEGVSLLQRWLDGSSDVQSAALVAARCLPPALLRAARPRHWLHSYRSLLDSWQLYWARCALDTWAGAPDAGGAEGAGGARQVCVACSYCGKAVAPPARPRPLARLPPPAAKMKQISSCPHCRKPLPRCGVCSLHLGAGGAGAGGAPFATWFSWCVACRHGGHAAHLIDWFKEHSECPVSSCNCRCSSLDPPDRL